MEKEKEVRSCAEVFDRMRASALSPETSADLLRRLADELIDAQ
jgi:hypothetical protein